MKTLRVSALSADLVLTAFASSSRAQNVPVGSVPGWVIEREIPARMAPSGDGVSVLLTDAQLRLSERAVVQYGRTAIRADTARALQDAGMVVVSWKPGVSDVTVNHVLIRRGHEVIDVLARRASTSCGASNSWNTAS